MDIIVTISLRKRTEFLEDILYSLKSGVSFFRFNFSKCYMNIDIKTICEYDQRN